MLAPRLHFFGERKSAYGSIRAMEAKKEDRPSGRSSLFERNLRFLPVKQAKIAVLSRKAKTTDMCQMYLTHILRTHGGL